MKRSHLQNQYWYCEDCERKTVHEIPPASDDEGILPSGWYIHHMPKIRFYRRHRRCKECECELETAELTENELGSLLKELKELRKCKCDIEGIVNSCNDENETISFE